MEEGMTEMLLVKVICGSCGKLIGRIVGNEEGDIGYRMAIAGGALNLNPRSIFCPEHGWPDLNDPAVLRKIEKARATQTTVTHRARCSSLRPAS
jgi:hypothetical protein